MIINGKKLLELAPIKDMLDHSEIANGVSYGLSESGYDIRCTNDIVFRPKEHNGRFRLDVSMEEFQMPDNLLGSVCDKSTFARAGVSVKNTKIKPGWRGHLTIELFYEKDDDFTIKAGTSVCQIIFEETYESVAYNGIYQDQGSDPEAYRLYPHQEKALKECISSSPLKESTLSDKSLKDMTREELYAWAGRALAVMSSNFVTAAIKSIPTDDDTEETQLGCACDYCVKAPEKTSSDRKEKIFKIFNILNIEGNEWSEIYSSKSDEYIDSKLEALEWLLDNSDHIQRNDRYQVLLDGASEYLVYKRPDFLNKVWECTKCVDSNGRLDQLYLASAFYKEINDFYKKHRESNTLNTPLAEWAVSLAVGYFTYRRTVLKQLGTSMDENREVLKNIIDDIYSLFTSDRNRSHYLEKLIKADAGQREDDSVTEEKSSPSDREKKIRKIFWILNLDREIWSKIYASYSDEYIDSKLEALNWLYNNTESIALRDGFHMWLDEISELLIHKGPKSLGRLWECTKYVDKHHPSDYETLEKLCMSRIDLWRESIHEHGISEFPKKDWTVRLALGYFTYRWVVVEIPFLLEIDRYASITDLLNGIYNIFKGDIDRAHYLEKLAEMDSEYL